MATALSGARRRLPGIAGRYPASNSANSGQVIFMKGVIIDAQDWVQVVETDSKIYRLVRLIGSTYLYFCEACKCSVYQEEVTRQGKSACPFCGGAIRPVDKGEKVRLHYRFAKDASWGEWWGEKWEW